MEIFMKKLTSVDIGRRLELPTDTSEEGLPPFRGARDNVIPIMFEQARFDVHCSCGPRRLEFTKGWIEIVKRLGLIAGDVVNLRREDQDACNVMSDSTIDPESPVKSGRNRVPLWLEGFKRSHVVSVSGIHEFSYKVMRLIAIE
ncbi:hypothetical protein NC652_012155 [Populus alba x Populus x berolinensis]|nr:hypothetical protein NC652_012155 [Populus alba x Populus x berolinensis]